MEGQEVPVSPQRSTSQAQPNVALRLLIDYDDDDDDDDINDDNYYQNVISGTT